MFKKLYCAILEAVVCICVSKKAPLNMSQYSLFNKVAGFSAGKQEKWNPEPKGKTQFYPFPFFFSFT